MNTQNSVTFTTLPVANASSSLVAREYNGVPFLFRGDGYFNGTDAAKHFGKDIREFFKNAGTKHYLEELAKMMGFPSNILKPSTKGRNGATWLHPKLAVFFARWLDVRFSVWCDMTIDNILHGNLAVTVAVPTEEALLLKDSLDAAKARILQLEGEVKELQEGGLKEGLPPAGWMTARNFLEDTGMVL